MRSHLGVSGVVDTMASMRTLWDGHDEHLKVLNLIVLFITFFFGIINF